MDKLIWTLGIVMVGLFGLLIWLIIEDSRQMQAKQVAFMEQCLVHRPRYDCELQWDTFAAAHQAEVNSAIAAANASMAAANAGASR